MDKHVPKERRLQRVEEVLSEVIVNVIPCRALKTKITSHVTKTSYVIRWKQFLSELKTRIKFTIAKKSLEVKGAVNL